MPTPVAYPPSWAMRLHRCMAYPPQKYICKYKKLSKFGGIMENLMVIRVEVIAPEKPLISKHLQK
jgi:hypothetical protein